MDDELIQARLREIAAERPPRTLQERVVELEMRLDDVKAALSEAQIEIAHLKKLLNLATTCDD